tara:strand:- start:302 stop:613 length:312 start_codon:yes stop_codon:yes gene_type:complete
MEFLIGLSTALLLAPFFVLVVYLMQMLPPEFTLGAVALMFLGDGTIGAIVYYVGIDFIENPKFFKLGIGCSFIVVTIFKVVYMVLNQSTMSKILEGSIKTEAL